MERSSEHGARDAPAARPGSYVPERWTFESERVADEFDSHVREQLPWYDLVSKAVAHIARHYIPAHGLVYDIGASNGNVSRLLCDTLEERRAEIHSVESSREMVDRWAGVGVVHHADALDFDYRPFDLAVLFLVVMFLPVASRKDFVHKLVETARPGGAIVVVDREMPSGEYPSLVFTRLALANKLASGVTPDEIVRKELSLGGVQRPVSRGLFAGWHEWFRLGDFVGYLWENKV